MGYEVYLFISGTFKLEKIKHNLKNSYRFCWKEKVHLGLSLQKTVCEEVQYQMAFKKPLKKLKYS